METLNLLSTPQDGPPCSDLMPRPGGWVRTKEAVDEAEGEADGAHRGWDDIILDINLQRAYVHLS